MIGQSPLEVSTLSLGPLDFIPRTARLRLVRHCFWAQAPSESAVNVHFLIIFVLPRILPSKPKADIAVSTGLSIIQ
jgi:hypothetical protein